MEPSTLMMRAARLALDVCGDHVAAMVAAEWQRTGVTQEQYGDTVEVVREVLACWPQRAGSPIRASAAIHKFLNCFEPDASSASCDRAAASAIYFAFDVVGLAVLCQQTQSSRYEHDMNRHSKLAVMYTHGAYPARARKLGGQALGLEEKDWPVLVTMLHDGVGLVEAVELTKLLVGPEQP